MQPIKRETSNHINKLCKIKNAVSQDFTAFVGMTGFEPAAPTSRTWCATGLRYIPKNWIVKITYTNSLAKLQMIRPDYYCNERKAAPI